MKRALLAEYLGSALLAAVVIGSGVAAQHLSPHEIGLELLENSAVTAAGLYTIILMFGPVSGGHFNPVVSLADASFGGIRWRTALAYIPAQTAGCVSGALLANAMFALPAPRASRPTTVRSPAHLLAEIVATAGLLLVIFALARTRRPPRRPLRSVPTSVPPTGSPSSTSFANPAITVGRIFSNTFAGIAPASAPAFVAGAARGGLAAVVLVRTLYPDVTPADAAQVMLPHNGARLAAPSTPRSAAEMANVLFVCLHNAGRSQMSQALFDRAAAGRHAARSAGTEPAEHVHPAVVEAMHELGTDLSDRTPQLLTDELAQWADVVVTMGCGDACPYIPGKRYIDWDLPDPAGRPIDEVRAVRDEIATRVGGLVAELDALT